MRRWCPSSLIKCALRSPNLFIERSRNLRVILHGSDLSSSSCFRRSPVIGSWSTDPSPLSVSPSHLEASGNCDFRDWKRKYGDSCGLPGTALENLRFYPTSSSGSPSPLASTFLSLYSRSLWSRRQERDSRVRSRGLSSAVEQSSETNATTTAGGEVSQKVVEIVDEVTGLTLMEIADLTEVLRKKFGVDEMPMMDVMMPGMGMGGVGGGARAGGAKAEEKKAEKTAFDLKLESFDAASKIKIIKEVRTFTDLGLKEAKDLVEKTPTLLKKGVLKEEAEKIIEKMKAVGANVVME
ncbi:54S ribosomal protein L12, mitochondrial-like [Nymphaea colorata]|nr:54S ribosomal protein L12, mitochondrial-like [Nymphaea colorata]